jgi:hypothetical protein
MDRKTVSALTIEPHVAALQIPDARLAVPPLNDSGMILNEAEGDLYDVNEMDHMYSHGFKSSFVLHHLSTAVCGPPGLRESAIESN